VLGVGEGAKWHKTAKPRAERAALPSNYQGRVTDSASFVAL